MPARPVKYDPEGTKRCACCRERKPYSEFGHNVRQPDGFHFYCKSCKNAKGRAWYEQHREQRRRAMATYYREHRGVIRGRRRRAASD